MKFSNCLSGIALVCATAFSSGAHAQSVQRTSVHMVIAESDMPIDEVRMAGKDDPLLVTYAQSPRAVRLDDDVKLGTLADVVTISEGTILFGRYDHGIWTFCSVEKVDAASEVINKAVVGFFTAGLGLLTGATRNFDCLYDENDDGVFDSAWTGGETDKRNAFLAFSLYPKAMSGNPRYTEVDASEGPAVPVRIDWGKTRNSATLNLVTYIGTMDVNKKTVAAPAPGAEPEVMKLLGAELEIIGYDAQAETLKYNVKSNTSEYYINLPATLTTTYY